MHELRGILMIPVMKMKLKKKEKMTRAKRRAQVLNTGQE
jgi:hypothetical protein